jgi:hypothetical protein
MEGEQIANFARHLRVSAQLEKIRRVFALQLGGFLFLSPAVYGWDS